ncbi:NfeD family protein [Enterovibrio calviensis]|uniref:NfeD family protein n=1 Tax=Enterovibrio calviensis TaxID=91359 RepID=UPI00048240BD|nr:NfeD family protein [Enterovibrio calviensis]
MDVMAYIQENLAEVTVILGLVFLIVEVWLLGLSTIVLLALGLSTVTTGVLVWFGVLPATVSGVVAASGIGAGVLTAALWLPMKNSQKTVKREFNIHSDLIGLNFVLDAELDSSHPGTVRYSGVNWKLVLAPNYHQTTLPIGASVKVVAVDVGKFTVEPVESAAE